MRHRPSPHRAWHWGMLLLATLGASSRARAEGAGQAPPADAGASVEAAVVDPRATQIRALLAGTLDVGIDPQSLFDVSLADEGAVQIDAARVRTLLQGLEDSARAIPSARGPSKPSASASAAASAQSAIQALDPVRWGARLDLDRARLEFYSLPPQRREELLTAQAVRREASRPKETDEERRQREAEEERERALAAARSARTEAERALAEEMARLVAIEREVAHVQGQFHVLRGALATRRESLIGWQRRVREAKAGTPSDADGAYDALRRALRGSRDELSNVLVALNEAASRVPELGPDRLSEIPADISTAEVIKRRTLIARRIDEARAAERSVADEQASTLLDEVTVLNRERLGLLPYLSQDKGDAITGFTGAGLDQARAEMRHLFLVLSYHRHVIGGWIASLRQRQGPQGVSVWGVLGVGVPWLIAGVVFSWVRRRSPAALTALEQRLADDERSERRASPSLQLRALRLLEAVLRPAEWLIFFGVLLRLMPATARGLLEVELLVVVVGWTLGGALLVDAINALAAGADRRVMRATDQIGHLRLRSLRLVGRVVVVFALILLLSGRLVGEGTVYHWVLSTCWVAALPLFLTLVRWWRETVFERVERIRRKSATQAWVLTNRSGWKSFFAAMLAAVQLFALGLYKTIRNWLAGFELTRRAHAYLFKRELDRLASSRASHIARPLSAQALASLSPARSSDAWVGGPLDEPLERLLRSARTGTGGIVAIVGGLGMGKSSLLARLRVDEPSSVSISGAALCSAERRRAIFERCANGERASGAEAAAPPLILVDDAHALIRPILGGLKAFDEVLAYARTRCESSLWVFAIDGVTWPFLQRARDARPLFDQVIVLAPWTDEQIGDLLTARSSEAGFSPIFDDLIEALPAAADEIEHEEALAEKRAGYFRMIWDYSRGNPAMALAVWSASLAESGEGAVRVRALQAPHATELELLPDAALFILRAVLQIVPATPSAVAHATRLTEEQVENAFRFGQAHGYLVEENAGMRVSWTWLRAVVQLLERRHLLVNP